MRSRIAFSASILLVLAPAWAGCLGEPALRIEESIVAGHSVSHRLHENFSVEVFFRLTNVNTVSATMWEADSYVRWPLEGKPVDQASGRITKYETIRPREQREVHLLAKYGSQAVPTRFDYTMSFGSDEPERDRYAASHTFLFPCYRIPTLEEIPGCNEARSLGITSAPLPDHPRWQQVLTNCCGWAHRPADVYAIECRSLVVQIARSVECEFVVGNIQTEAAPIESRVEVFANDTLAGAQKLLGSATIASDGTVQPREARAVNVSIGLPTEAILNDATSYLVRVSVWPQGREADAAVEERWITGVRAMGAR